MEKNSGEIIQAFPITASTYVGTPTDLVVKGYELIHCNADTSITFNFVGSTITITCLAGQDFAFSSDVQTITSTAEVIIS